MGRKASPDGPHTGHGACSYIRRFSTRRPQGRSPMLVHVIADYGPGDLAFAKVSQRFAVLLPDSRIVCTPVPPFATLAAGFYVAQLGLIEAPKGTLVFHNVAPREDPRHSGGRCLARRSGCWPEVRSHPSRVRPGAEGMMLDSNPAPFSDHVKPSESRTGDPALASLKTSVEMASRSLSSSTDTGRGIDSLTAGGDFSTLPGPSRSANGRSRRDLKPHRLSPPRELSTLCSSRLRSLTRSASLKPLEPSSLTSQSRQTS